RPQAYHFAGFPRPPCQSPRFPPPPDCPDLLYSTERRGGGSGGRWPGILVSVTRRSRVAEGKDSRCELRASLADGTGTPRRGAGVSAAHDLSRDALEGWLPVAEQDPQPLRRGPRGFRPTRGGAVPAPASHPGRGLHHLLRQPRGVLPRAPPRAVASLRGHPGPARYSRLALLQSQVQPRRLARIGRHPSTAPCVELGGGPPVPPGPSDPPTQCGDPEVVAGLGRRGGQVRGSPGAGRRDP